MGNPILDLSPLLNLTDEQYYQLCQNNPNLKIERDKQGKIIIMSPTGGETGRRNIDILGQLWLWGKQNPGLGVAFDSSTEFSLPQGGDRSPDAAWVKLERWQSLTDEQKKKFPPICPDFVIELRSESDSLKELRVKMQEYLDSGLRLGWLIDPQNKTIELYKPQTEVEILQSPSSLDAADILPGFVLDLDQIWT